MARRREWKRSAGLICRIGFWKATVRDVIKLRALDSVKRVLLNFLICGYLFAHLDFYLKVLKIHIIDCFENKNLIEFETLSCDIFFFFHIYIFSLSRYEMFRQKLLCQKPAHTSDPSRKKTSLFFN